MGDHLDDWPVGGNPSIFHNKIYLNPEKSKNGFQAKSQRKNCEHFEALDCLQMSG